MTKSVTCSLKFFRILCLKISTTIHPRTKHPIVAKHQVEESVKKDHEYEGKRSTIRHTRYNVFPRATMCISLRIITRIQIARYIRSAGRQKAERTLEHVRLLPEAWTRPGVTNTRVQLTYRNAVWFSIERGNHGRVVRRCVGVVSETADTTMPASFHIKSRANRESRPVNCPGTRTSPPAGRGKRKDAFLLHGVRTSTPFLTPLE